MADFQRFVSVERDVKSVKPEDKKVAVAGVVLSKEKDGFVLDDGTGRMRVSSDKDVKAKQAVRVLGLVQASGDGLELRADVVQDFSGVDIGIYKTARKLWTGV